MRLGYPSITTVTLVLLAQTSLPSTSLAQEMCTDASREVFLQTYPSFQDHHWCAAPGVPENLNSPKFSMYRCSDFSGLTAKRRANAYWQLQYTNNRLYCITYGGLGSELRAEECNDLDSRQEFVFTAVEFETAGHPPTYRLQPRTDLDKALSHGWTYDYDLDSDQWPLIPAKPRFEPRERHKVEQFWVADRLLDEQQDDQPDDDGILRRLIVDNQHSDFEGSNATLSRISAGYQGGYHYLPKGDEKGRCTWDLDDEEGNYDIYMTWTPNSNRAHGFSAQLSYATLFGELRFVTSEAIDQRSGHIKKIFSNVPVGPFLAKVSVDSQASGHVICDAVFFVKKGAVEK